MSLFGFFEGSHADELVDAREAVAKGDMSEREFERLVGRCSDKEIDAAMDEFGGWGKWVRW